MPNNFKVDHPEQFPAGDRRRARRRAGAECDGRGESGRLAAGAGAVAGHRARSWKSTRGWATTVKKGQLLFKVRSTDIAGAYSDYRKAVKNEQLTRKSSWIAPSFCSRTARFPRARSKSRRTPRTTTCSGRRRDRHRASPPAGRRSGSSDRNRRSVRAGFGSRSPTSKSPISPACRR